MTTAALKQIGESLAQGDLTAAVRMIHQVRAGLSSDDPLATRATAARAAATANRLSGDPRSALPLVNEALDLAADPGNHDPAVAIDAELELADILTTLGDVERSKSAQARADRLAAAADVPQALRWKVSMRCAALEIRTNPERAVQRLESLAAQIPDVPKEVVAPPSPRPPPAARALELLAPLSCR